MAKRRRDPDCDADRSEACEHERDEWPDSDLSACKPGDALRIDQDLPHLQPREESRRHSGPVPFEELDQVEVRADRDDQLRSLFVGEKERDVFADSCGTHELISEPEVFRASRTG